ncbi:MAG: 4-hydroxyphenylacetate decarboxylase small subunit [Bradymonadales bacterium]|nr:4-hydroxyphenylacetate decarboxylase small subunit [Bradymonadales bacterium]
MEPDGHSHMDCRNYASLDVTRGICHRTKEMVMAEGAGCEEFEPLPRCKLCVHYEPAETPYLGRCLAEQDRPMTYPDLAAVTCAWFEGKAEPLAKQ